MPEKVKERTAAGVALTPYQEDFVDRVVSAPPPARFVLLAPPGAGKTIALACVAERLKQSQGTLRCLVIAPAALVALWREQLMRFAGTNALAMTPQAYRQLQSESEAGVNVWSQVSAAIASGDFLKLTDRLDELLKAEWDLVILDEAHRATDPSQRGTLARGIWKSPLVKTAIAASEIPIQRDWLDEDGRTIAVRWRLADLVAAGRIPERRIHAIHYSRSESERQIVLRIQNLIENGAKDQQSQFTLGLLARRLDSSLYALELTLRRLLTVETFGDTDLNDWLPDDLSDESDEGRNPSRIDRQAVEEILSLLERETNDSKWESCLQLLNSRGVGTTCSGVLFTEFVDTADYLEFLAKSRGLRVFTITGAVSAGARLHALHEAQSSPTLLVVTGAVEGIDLQFTNQVIHYDLPRSPTGFVQRIGRFERISTQAKFVDHYCTLEKSTASTVMESLLEKIQSIEQEWA